MIQSIPETVCDTTAAAGYQVNMTFWWLLRVTKDYGLSYLLLYNDIFKTDANRKHTLSLLRYKLKARAVLTNGHVPRAPDFFFFLRGPQLAAVK